MSAIEFAKMDIKRLLPYRGNPRKIGQNAIDAVANSISQFGFNQPIAVNESNVILCGHTRYLAAKQLKIDTVPVVIIHDLTPVEEEAFRIADNKTGERSTWDTELLRQTIDTLQDNVDWTLFFTAAELGELLGGKPEEEPEELDFTLKFNVIVECETEDEAHEVFTSMTSAGGEPAQLKPRNSYKQNTSDILFLRRGSRRK